MFLYFTAPWCQPCKQLGPIMDSFSSEYEIHKIDVSEDPALAQTYGVQSIPTVIAIAAGTEKSRFTGGRDKDRVARFLQSL